MLPGPEQPYPAPGGAPAVALPQGLAGDQGPADVFHLSVRVAAALRERYGPWVYPLSEGYVLMAADRDQTCLAEILHAAFGRRTVVLTNHSDEDAAITWPDGWQHAHTACLASATGETRLLASRPETVPAHSVLFVIMRSLVRRALRTAPPAGQGAGGAAVWPDLDVTVVGVGPGGDAPLQVRTETLGAVEHIVVFDRIEHRVLAGLRPAGQTHVVPYVYADFTRSIRLVTDLLTSLACAGARSVAIAVEGNTEVFDLAPRLARFTRRLTVVPAKPIALHAIERVTRIAGRPLIGASYAMTSGIPRRHPANRDGLRREMLGYLRAGLGCLLLEMYSGDRALIAEWAAAVGPGCLVAILSDMFSPAEHVEVMDTAQFLSVSLPRPPRAGSRLVTVAISGTGAPAADPAWQP